MSRKRQQKRAEPTLADRIAALRDEAVRRMAVLQESRANVERLQSALDQAIESRDLEKMQVAGQSLIVAFTRHQLLTLEEQKLNNDLLYLVALLQAEIKGKN